MHPRFVQFRWRDLRLTSAAVLGTIRTAMSFALLSIRFLVRWTIGWAFGWELGYLDATGTPAPKTIYGEVISLFGMTLTNAIALALSQASATEPNRWYIFIYGWVALTIIAGMVVMLNTTSKTVGKLEFGELAKHAYERGSIMFTRTFLFTTTVLSGVIVFLACTGQLPGQDFTEETEGKLGRPENYHFKSTKVDGIMVQVTLDKCTFPSGIPEQLNMKIVLKGELARKWKVQEVVGYVGDAKSVKEMAYQPAAGETDPKFPGRYLYLLEGLSNKEDYHLKVYVHSLSKEGLRAFEIEEAKEAIRAGEMTVKFLSKKRR